MGFSRTLEAIQVILDDDDILEVRCVPVTTPKVELGLNFDPVRYALYT